MDTGRAYNPYSSHRLEPGRGGYIFCDEARELGLIDLMGRIESRVWRAELVGQHGAGKSTLLTDICGTARSSGVVVARWQCSDRRRFYPSGWFGDLIRSRVIAIDGAERLAPGLLWFARLFTWIGNRGLIITAHRRTGLGELVSVCSSTDSLVEKVRMAGGSESDIDGIAERLEYHGGNAREVLFDLYLEYEGVAQSRTDAGELNG